MAKKQIVALDQQVVQKIDNNRGDLSRDDFISFCIDTVCEPYVEEETAERVAPPVAAPSEARAAVSPKAEGEFATREEFLELKRGITSLMRAFLEFFITFGMELGPSKGVSDIEKLRAQLRAIMEEK